MLNNPPMTHHKPAMPNTQERILKMAFWFFMVASVAGVSCSPEYEPTSPSVNLCVCKAEGRSFALRRQFQAVPECLRTHSPARKGLNVGKAVEAECRASHSPAKVPSPGFGPA